MYPTKKNQIKENQKFQNVLTFFERAGHHQIKFLVFASHVVTLTILILTAGHFNKTFKFRKAVISPM